MERGGNKRGIEERKGSWSRYIGLVRKPDILHSYLHKWVQRKGEREAGANEKKNWISPQETEHCEFS